MLFKEKTEDIFLNPHIGERMRELEYSFIQTYECVQVHGHAYTHSCTRSHIHIHTHVH